MRSADTKSATRGVFDDLLSLRIFARLVEVESFSDAARRLDITPATVSKHISALEAKIGARLVNRTTRRLSVTEAGLRLYERCRRVLLELEEAETELLELQSEPRGIVRVTAPTVFAVRHISPHLPKFLGRYPKLKVDLHLAIRTVDLYDEHIDVAVRITETVEPGLVAVRLAPNRRVFCAGPAYLRAQGVPQKPPDLLNHNCLVVRSRAPRDSWPVQQGDHIGHVQVTGNLMADNGEVIRDAACAELGIAMLPLWLIEDDLRAGRLIEILADHEVRNASIFAVLPQSGYLSPKIRCFIEFLKDCLSHFS